MKAVRIALFALLGFSSVWSSAQSLADNPLLQAGNQIGATGFAPGTVVKPTATAFKPASGRVYLPAYAKLAMDTKERQELFLTVAEGVAKAIEDIAGPLGHKNDAAVALAFTTVVLVAVQTAADVNDKAFPPLIERFQKTLDTANVRQATDRQKQEFYELCVGHAALVLTLASASDGADDEKAVKQVATRLLDSLLGATASQFTIKGTEITLKPSRPAAAATSSGLAPGFTYSKSSRWTETSGWLMKEAVSENSNGRQAHAMVRFLPAIPAQGNMGDALRKTWAQSLPAEMAGKASGMVFRRYTGDGLVTQFIYGVGREKTREFDTAFTVLMIDCKTHWQPIVLAQTYVNQFSTAGSGQSEQFSWPATQAVAEELFASFRCPTAKGMALASAESLVGNYAFGNGAAQNWVNIYTGATSSTFYSAGGELKLAKNGTFEWQMSIASGGVGTTRFQGEKGKGTWSIEGDQLIVKFTEYDKSLSAPPKERRYKIAGVTNFSDGKKVVILLSDLTILPALSTISPGSSWFVSGP